MHTHQNQRDHQVCAGGILDKATIDWALPREPTPVQCPEAQVVNNQRVHHGIDRLRPHGDHRWQGPGEQGPTTTGPNANAKDVPSYMKGIWKKDKRECGVF